MKINLRIERLALHDIQLTATGRAELAAAIQAELGRLMVSKNNTHTWAELGDQAHIHGKSITYQPGTSPRRLGKEVAGSLHSSLQISQPPQLSVKL